MPMTIPEIISGYESIISSMRSLEDHPLEAVRSDAKNQIARCENKISELKARIPE